MSSKGLGRGLDALLAQDGQAASQNGDSQIVSVSVASLVPNQDQPRKTMTSEGLEELASSIRSQGVIQPLLVRPLPGQPDKYQIVAGERRWRAACKAGLRRVPVYRRDLSDSDVMLVALMENLQREDLNPAEEAMAMQELKDRLDLTQEGLAERLGKSRSQVANALRLLQLPKKALECLQQGGITAGHARCLLGFTQAPDELERFLDWMVERRLPVRECEDILNAWKKGAPLPWSDPAAAAAPEPRQRRVKSRAFRRMEKDITRMLSVRARFSGTPDSGRLVFTYRSADELGRLLGAFGMDAAGKEDD